METTKKSRMGNFLTYIVLIIFAFFYSLPCIGMLGTALKGDVEALTNTALFPKIPTLEAFRAVLRSNFLLTAANSLKIGLTVSAICIVLSCMSGYALSRFRGRLYSAYGCGVMILQMFPMMLMIIPLFLIYKNLHLIDTHLSLILSYTCLNLPFSIWMMRGFFDTLPSELEESACIDGCSQLSALIHIVIPVSLPGIATAGIFTFLNVWNEYTFANTFIKNPDHITLTVGLQQYIAQSGNSWGQMMAASCLGMVPSILFLVFAQKYLVQGLTSGAVKG